MLRAYKSIRAAIGRDPNVIHPGQVLLMPDEYRPPPEGDIDMAIECVPKIPAGRRLERPRERDKASGGDLAG